MTRSNSFCVLLLTALIVQLLLCLSALSQPSQPTPASRIARINGVPTMLVNGNPFFVIGAQCDIWRSTKQDDKTVAFFDGYHDMGATTVSVGIPWSKVEPLKDGYDFKFVDWFIHQADSRGLKLVLNLFDTNICGKVLEGSPGNAYPQYTPGYILDHPETYHRMVLPYPYRYVDGGPPMCPNDPNTLERERRLVVQLVTHLRDTDSHRTVIMLQLDNEFYYQQWDGKRPEYGSAEEKSIRCQCPNCEAKWAAGSYKDGEDFMFRSFADYVRVLTDSIAGVYRLPMYLNSPWWHPYVIPLFLDRCPNLDFVGVDGVFSPREPAIFSDSQVGRNLPFAAENPTEVAETRLNLDVLPYYTLVGRPGIGNLLWECHPPNTVVDDPVVKERYRESIAPITAAMRQIGLARGTDRIVGWFRIRNEVSGLTTDVSGNYVARPADSKIVDSESTRIREGATLRDIKEDHFETHIAGLTLQVTSSPAGIIVQTGKHEVIIAAAHGEIRISGAAGLSAQRGSYKGDKWLSQGSATLGSDQAVSLLRIESPGVVRLSWSH